MAVSTSLIRSNKCEIFLFILAFPEAFLDCKESLSNRQVEFGEYITKEVCALCSVHLKSANDIPRLYRRTNREVSSIFFEGVIVNLFNVMYCVQSDSRNISVCNNAKMHQSPVGSVKTKPCSH